MSESNSADLLRAIVSRLESAQEDIDSAKADRKRSTPRPRARSRYEICASSSPAVSVASRLCAKSRS